MAVIVNQAFEVLRSRLELTKTLQDKVTSHHTAVREWLGTNKLTDETKLIGSLQRKTRIQPRAGKDIFDIDILVILGKFTSWRQDGISPTHALNMVEAVLSENETYEKMGPETDSPAIVVEYTDKTKIELVPAYLDGIGRGPNGIPTPPAGRGYWVP